MQKSQWVPVKGESNVAVKAQCAKCTYQDPPEELRVLVLKTPDKEHTRHTGRLLICGGDCLQHVDWDGVIFDKPLAEVTAEDVKWIINYARVNYTIYKHDLLVDFCIAVHMYREDVRFQNL